MALKDAYLGMLHGLLPQGQAWNRDPDSTLTKVLSVFSQILGTVHSRGLDLLDEADPRTTAEMLLDWEYVAGLPDGCTLTSGTLQERRAALVQRITGRGGQSRPYYLSLAQALGYDIEITEYRPFICGASECGVGQVPDAYGIIETAITDIEGIRHFWKVKVLGPRVTWFECGASECGIDPFAKISVADDLECLFYRLKPAHTHLTFAYEG